MTTESSGPIRVLQIVGNMNRGGVETWLMHVLRRLDRKVWAVDFAVCPDLPAHYDAEIRTLGSRRFPYSHPRHLRSCTRDLRTILRRHGPYRAVHSHNPSTDGLALRAARREGVPVRILHCHNDMSLSLPPSPWARAYLRWSMATGRRHATHGLAASSSAAASYFGRDWRRDSRWRVHPCALDFSTFGAPVDRRALREALGIAEDAFVVGHVGRFIKQKNHEFLLQIAACLAPEEPELRLLLVGDGPLRETIEGRAAQLGIADRVVFAGSRSDVPALLRGAMDLFLFPSLFEGLGLALVEAQAAGLPCVCADVIPREGWVVPSLITIRSLDQPPAAWAEAVVTVRRVGRPISPEEALARVEASPMSLSQGGLEALTRIYRAV